MSGVAGQVGTASAAAVDPITNQAAPTLTAPADDPAGNNLLKDVVLKWSAVSHADSYEVQISPNDDWTNNVVKLPNGGKTVNNVYEVPLSLPHAFYYWRVRALHGSAHTAWSKERVFLREWVRAFDMLTVPTSIDPSLSWEPVPQASLYRVRFNDEADFSGKDDHSCATAQTSFTPYTVGMTNHESLSGDCFDASVLKPGVEYFWEVVAYDDSSADVIVADTANDPGWECKFVQPECNAYFLQHSVPSFTFQPVDAGTPSPTAVVTGRTTSWHNASGSVDCSTGSCPTTPTFSWDPVSGANFYEVHVWRDPALSNTYRVYETAYPSITPRDNLFDAQAGTPYYWTVSPGTCRNSLTQDFCASDPDAAATGNPVCPEPADASAAPTVGALSVTPAGPHGAQSMAAGDAGTITLTGTNFDPAVCIQASVDGGIIKNVARVSDTKVTFDYTAPDAAGNDPLTFSAINPDGGNGVSPELEIVGAFKKVELGPATFPVVSFVKRSGNVDLSSPSNGAAVHDQSVTFSWSDFMATGGQGALDARNYHLQVATDADFDQVKWDFDDIDLTQFTNPKALLPDGTWYWRVQPIDESGNHLTWSKTAKFTQDASPPQLSLHKSGKNLVVSSTEPARGVSASTVHLVADHGMPAVHGKVTRTSPVTWRFVPTSEPVAGESYQLSVASSVKDESGNAAIVVGRSVAVSSLADDKSDGWSFNGAWARHTSSQAIGGTFSSSRKGHAASVKVVGTTVRVIGCRGPEFGKLQVLVDGSSKATVNEHRSFTKCGVVVWKGSVSGAAHTVKLVAKSGTANFDAVEVS